MPLLTTKHLPDFYPSVTCQNAMSFFLGSLPIFARCGKPKNILRKKVITFYQDKNLLSIF